MLCSSVYVSVVFQCSLIRKKSVMFSMHDLCFLVSLHGVLKTRCSCVHQEVHIAHVNVESTLVSCDWRRSIFHSYRGNTDRKWQHFRDKASHCPAWSARIVIYEPCRLQWSKVRQLSSYFLLVIFFPLSSRVYFFY